MRGVGLVKAGVLCFLRGAEGWWRDAPSEPTLHGPGAFSGIFVLETPNFCAGVQGHRAFVAKKALWRLFVGAFAQRLRVLTFHCFVLCSLSILLANMHLPC